MISYDEFSKLDLRVAEILEVNDHQNADKLYVLKIDLGDEQRTLVAGLKQFYSIATPYDGSVQIKSTKLAGARHITVNVHGHMSLLFSKQVFDEITKILE